MLTKEDLAAMQGMIDASGNRMMNAISTSIEASENRMMSVIDGRIEPQIRLITETVQSLNERMTPKDKLNDLKKRVDFLESVLRDAMKKLNALEKTV